MLLVRVVYPLKNPCNASLACLDNGLITILIFGLVIVLVGVFMKYAIINESVNMTEVSY